MASKNLANTTKSPVDTDISLPTHLLVSFGSIDGNVMLRKLFFHFCRVFQPLTQNYIGHILDGLWGRHRCLSVLHMTICYQNEFEDGTKTSCLLNQIGRA